MIIGVDFDNTIVCYDGIFHRIAVERGLIPPEVPATKTAVRDYLRRTGNEPAFTEMQGYVYGPRLVEAEMFPGVKEFFRACRERGLIVKIISHKTRFPYMGEWHDLHAAARGWLEHHGFFDPAEIGLPTDAAYFELTKEEKLARIAATGCDVFIDDLPELLAEQAFPANTRRVLFDPLDTFSGQAVHERARSWAEISGMIPGLSDDRALSAEIHRAAHALFEAAEMKLAAAPVRLAGGGNNRVFAARDGLGTPFLLKQYFFQSGDQRNRFESERLFYRLAAVAAPTQTPRALGWEATSRLGLFEFVEGRKSSAVEIGTADLNTALEFFVALNRARDRPEAQALPLAAEACFTLVDHVQSIDRRLARLSEGISGSDAIDAEAAQFVEDQLRPQWGHVRSAVVLSDAACLTAGERCISPSDFGFHNCLRRANGQYVFFDFEYGGWDGPAKTVCDFFCQPAIPVPLGAFDMFARGVAGSFFLGDPEVFVRCCVGLLPLYRLKWCAITLNEFVVGDRQRRDFAIGFGASVRRKELQLALARRMLESVPALMGAK